MTRARWPMSEISRVCVFCGSNFGNRPDYAEAARALALALVNRGVALVYGGSSVGLMGALADEALAAGGRVIGIIPQRLVDKEVAHGGLSEQHVVASMHERKALMADLADGFVALPGGIGTLEELFEVWTWGQLGYHGKPVGILNAGGYFDALGLFLDQAVREGFLRPAHRAMLAVETDPGRLLDRFAAYEPPDVGKWIRARER